jgi:NAD(P)-dependent dehydrogenase (short-subunit alcohol dehydrogenase family)
MKVSMKGKVVLITGASRGLGRAISLEFARRGANLALAARSPDGLDQTRQQAKRLGAEVITLQADVSSMEDVNALVRTTVERFGRIDVLVNNAGIARVGGVSEPSFADDVGAIMSASLFGMAAVTQTALPVLRRQGAGSIVNMSSIMGRKAFAKFGAYAIIVHAVSALSDALRQELRGSGVNVMTVYPALSESDLLRDVSPADMPPPFRYLTPLTAERVAREVADGVERGRTRVVAPRSANMLLLGDAVSSHLGDWIADALAQGWLARILLLSSGKTYHEAINTPPLRRETSTGEPKRLTS